MIFDVVLAIILGSLTAFLLDRIAAVKANVDLLNNYAFTSFERIIALETVLDGIETEHNEEPHDNQT